jgi:hypothetical protein
MTRGGDSKWPKYIKEIEGRIQNYSNRLERRISPNTIRAFRQVLRASRVTERHWHGGMAGLTLDDNPLASR